MSDYISRLNTYPSPEDGSTQQGPSYDFNDMIDFESTQFYDLDIGEMADINVQPMDFNAGRGGSRKQSTAPGVGMDNSLDFLNQDFSFPDLSGLPAIAPNDGVVPVTGAPAGMENMYHASAQQAVGSPLDAAQPNVGDKRKADSMSSPSTHMSLEEKSRLAAEEDKRRRNTAASARFRVKKKQREQALEKREKELTEKVAGLEAEVKKLQMENSMLKELIHVKNDSTTISDLKQSLSQAKAESRSTSERNDGVGTSKTETKA